MASVALLVFAVIWLAYANGANDNYKGVATLFGSRTSDYRQALSWGTLTTLVGSLTSLFLATSLVETFSGKGLVTDSLVADSGFLVAVGLGAAVTVFLASLFGIPISTTHSLTGALVGAGIAASWSTGFSRGFLGAVNLNTLNNKFAIPLLASPLIASVLTAPVYLLFHRLRFRLGVDQETCFCVVNPEESPCRASVNFSEGTAQLPVSVPPILPQMKVDTRNDCEVRYRGNLVGIDAQTLLDRFHFLSAGAVSFARGLNDTPKIVSLLVTARILGVSHGLVVVGLAIAVGGWISAAKVADTMSLEITPMNPGQGFTANVVTAFLVIIASRWGVPVSTTHVSCGSLFGIGLVGGTLRWKIFAGILMAWVATLPLAAFLSAATYLTLSLF